MMKTILGLPLAARAVSAERMVASTTIIKGARVIPTRLGRERAMARKNRERFRPRGLVRACRTMNGFAISDFVRQSDCDPIDGHKRKIPRNEAAVRKSQNRRRDMRLPSDAAIARAKLTKYLLEWRAENDKSQFLLQAGYTAEKAERLEQDIREQLLTLEVEFEEETEYGNKYRIYGSIKGPNGRVLEVVSIWMIERATGVAKFITLYPRR